MTQLKMLSAADKLTEIRRLYFATSRQSIQGDLAKALDLLKSMSTEDERERATVYMEGLAEMAKDWSRDSAPKGARKATPGGKRPARGGAPAKGSSAAKPGVKPRSAKPPAGVKKRG